MNEPGTVTIPTVGKAELADRYSVSMRTIEEWMAWGLIIYHCRRSVAARTTNSENKTTSPVLPCEPYDVTA